MLLLNIHRNVSVQRHLKEIHWLPIRARVKFKGLVLAHGAFYAINRKYLSKRLLHYHPSRTLCSADALLAFVPKTRCKRWGGTFFSALAAASWNALPLHLHAIRDVGYIKGSLKNRLFNDAN